MRPPEPPARRRGPRRPEAEGASPLAARCAARGQAAGLRLLPGLGAAVPSAARRDSGLSAAGQK